MYWLPVIRQHYTSDSVPSHPGLQLVWDCEQVLSSNTSRRLIVMQRNLEDRDKVVGEEARVSSHLALFKDQFYLPLAGNISRKERKERIKEHGHLNLTEEEIGNFTTKG